MIACLAILQQEHGFVSPESEELVADGARHAADRGARGHDLLQHVQPGAGRAGQAERLHQPAVPAARRPARARAPVRARSASQRAAPPPTASSRCRRPSASAPAPTRRCCWSTTGRWCSFMSDARLDELVVVLACADRGEAGMNATFDLSRFQATGQETCFHGRHIEPQIYAGLDGTQLAPEGLRGARRLQGAAQDPGARRGRRHDAGAGDRRGQGVGPARPRRRGLSDRPEVELHAAPVPGRRSTWSATPTKASPAPARTATS